MARPDRSIPRDADQRDDQSDARTDVRTDDARDARSGETPNPPHTTADGVTAPKFGSAGSGGLELEPGLDRD